jgi:hypothetical protein
MVASALIAHAGHPSEWLPFVAPIVLVALAWFVIRVREATGERPDEEASPGPQDRREQEDEGAGASRG